MSLDNVLSEVAGSVPECLVIGYVDAASGMLLAIRTVDSHPREVIDLVAAATADLFNGPNVSMIESLFKKSRGLKDDVDWQNASLYAGATQIYTGEIGRYEDVRFVSTTVMPNGYNNAIDSDTGDYVDVGFNNNLRAGVSGNVVNVYQAVMFGEYAMGHATALPVELRDSGVEDFGREHGLAWYSIWGSAIMENQNIVVIETALRRMNRN